ncbi:MAG: DUF3667 domain-containing protein [Flavobacteriales bacterium]|nr:DUF3667 domain-containing protein [Flavobacteriales bacterium]
MAKFCSNCGQENRNLHIGFIDLSKDFLGNNFNFDTKLLTTLRYLILKPGFLSEEFAKGRRAAYVPPIRLYLFISFIYFLAIGDGSVVDANMKMNGVTINPDIENPDSITSMLLGYNADSNNQIELDSMLTIMEMDTTDFNRHLAKQLVRLINDQDAFVEKWISNMSIAMFFLMPVFALLLWLMAAKPKPYYIDSLMFSLNIHSFFFLALTVEYIIAIFWPNGLIYTLLLIGMIGYIVTGTKRLQRINWKQSMAKTVLVTTCYMLVLGITFIAVMSISAWVF